MFDDYLRWPRQPAWDNDVSFTMDLYEDGDNLVLKAALPGVKPEDVDISIVNDTVTIKGEMKSEQETKQESYHRREIRYGSFARSATLPTRVNHEKTEATFKDGILTVIMPKADEVKPKSIKVKNTVDTEHAGGQ
jgi:HSP20 family protein